MDTKLSANLRELKFRLFLAAMATGYSEFFEARQIIMSILSGSGKFVYTQWGDVLFQNGSVEYHVGDLNEDDPNGIPETGILLDYFYLRHHFGHVSAMAYVNDFIHRHVEALNG